MSVGANEGNVDGTDAELVVGSDVGFRVGLGEKVRELTPPVPKVYLM